MSRFESLRKELYRRQRELGGCSMFKGNENLEELVTLFNSIEGRLFCARVGFPTIEEVRQLDKRELLKYGVYLDAGDIELVNADNIIIAGNTRAILHYSEPNSYNVNVQYGAFVEIHASGYAIVDLFNSRGNVMEHISGNAIIIHSNKPKRK